MVLFPRAPGSRSMTGGGVKMVGGGQPFSPCPCKCAPPPPCHLMRVTLGSRKTIINPYSLNTRIIGGRGGVHRPESIRLQGGNNKHVRGGRHPFSPCKLCPPPRPGK